MDTPKNSKTNEFIAQIMRTLLKGFWILLPVIISYYGIMYVVYLLKGYSIPFLFYLSPKGTSPYLTLTSHYLYSTNPNLIRTTHNLTPTGTSIACPHVTFPSPYIDLTLTKPTFFTSLQQVLPWLGPNVCRMLGGMLAPERSRLCLCLHVL